MLLQGIPHEGVHAFARAYTNAPFAGRTQDLAQLQAFLGGATSRGLLCAPAGRGKSALVHRWAQGLDDAGHRVIWLPISLRYGTHRSAVVEELLTARLRRLLDRSGHWRDLIASHEGPPLLLVLDGLDELQDAALLDALSALTLPLPVKLLASARTSLQRDAHGWATLLQWSPCERFDLARLTLEEIAACLASDPPTILASELMLRTDGDPLLVQICMDSIYKGEPLPRVEDPAELVGAWWAEQRARLQAPGSELAERALAALGAACGVVPWSVLASVLGVEEAEVRAVLQGFDRFVSEVEGQGLTFAHPRFAEIAWWTFPDATQRAHQRFAELALEARRGDRPPSYFLHFALPHLEAAGASDEALETLISAASLAAWQHAEGSALGMLREIQALRRRNARKLAAAWGTEELAPLLRQQAYLQTLATSLPAMMKELDPLFLRELVRHELRSATQALQIVSELPPSQQKDALSTLLPVLPDRVLPALLAICPTGDDSPDTSLLLRLIRADLLAEAQRYLEGFPSWPTNTLVKEAPSFSAVQQAWLRPLIEGRLPREQSHHAVQQRLVRLPLLPPDEQHDELNRCEQLLLELQDAPTSEDDEWREITSSSLFMEKATRLGRGDLALRWISSLVARDASTLVTHPRRIEHRSHLFFDLWPLLSGSERDEARGHWEEAVRRLQLSEEYFLQHRTCIPETFPGLEALEEAFWDKVREQPEKQATYILRKNSLPKRMREQAASLLLDHADRVFAHLESLPEEKRYAENTWVHLIRAFDRISLPSPAALFERLPRWVATLKSYTRLVDGMMIQNATTDETRAQVRGWLADGTVKIGSWLWESENWLEILPAEERAKILQEQLRQPPGSIEPPSQLLIVLEEMNPDQDREEMEALLAVMNRIVPNAAFFLALQAPKLQALFSQDDMEIFYELLSVSPPDIQKLSPWGLPLLALRHHDPRLSPILLARALLQNLSGGRLPWFVVEAELLKPIPREEAIAWIQQNCSQPQELATDLVSWCNSAARWKPEELEEIFQPQVRRPPPFYSVFEWNEPTSERYESIVKQTLRVLSRVPRPFWQEILEQNERELLFFLGHSDTETLLHIASQVQAFGAEKLYLGALIKRTVILLLKGAPGRPALEALLHRLESSENSSTTPIRVSQENKPLLWLWKHQELPPRERVQKFIESFESTLSFAPVARLVGLQEELAIQLLTRAQEPASLLWEWALVWGSLSQETRATLLPGVSASLKALQSSDSTDFRRELLLSWALDLVDEETLREVWLQEAERPKPTFLFPLEALRRIGGTAAVKAWVRGITQAFNLMPEAAPD